jgi:hypothetical protein
MNEYALRINPAVRVSLIRTVEGQVQYVGDDGIPLWGTSEAFHREFVAVETVEVINEFRVLTESSKP